LFVFISGTILHYNDPNKDLKNIYFINPSWLCRLMAKIITVDAVHTRIKNGILKISDLRNFIIHEDDEFPPHFYDKYLRLLYRFQIACQIDQDRVLVPSKLPERPQVIYKDPLDRNLLIRRHVFTCIPFGFWERFVSRLLLFMREMLTPSSEEEDAEDEHHHFEHVISPTLLEEENEEENYLEDDEHESESGDDEEELNLSINQSNNKPGGVVYVNVNTIPFIENSDVIQPIHRMVSVNGIQIDTESSTPAVSTLNSDSSSVVPSLGSIYPASELSTSYESSLPPSKPATVSSLEDCNNNSLGSSKDYETIQPQINEGTALSANPKDECLLSSSVDGSISVVSVTEVSPVVDDASKQIISTSEPTEKNVPMEMVNPLYEDIGSHIDLTAQNKNEKNPPLSEIIGRAVMTPSFNDEIISQQVSDDDETDRSDSRVSGHEERDFEIPKRVSGHAETNKINSTEDGRVCFHDYVDIAHFFDKKILVCWKSGIVFRHPKLFFSVRKIKSKKTKEDTIETKVSNTPIGHRVLGFIIDHIQTLIKEWYIGLAGDDGEHPYVSQYAACYICTHMGIDPHMFNVREAFAKIYISKSGDNCLSCDRSHLQLVDVDRLCPELLFKDLASGLQIERTSLVFEEHKDFFLGKGAFGNVYRGQYKMEADNGSLLAVSAAVKIYNFDDKNQTLNISHAQEAFHEIRQEIFILSKLRNQKFIVGFIGFALEPRLCALMELASQGNLKNVIRANAVDVILHRVVLFRIIKQVADGLSIMHKRRIIHRDIKSDNILVFSLSPDADVNVKISDFGTANFLTPIGMKYIAGTEGFMAPEMYDYNSVDEYTTKVDIYSFAMVISEMITGRRPFHDLEKLQIPDALRRGERPAYADIKKSLFGLLPITELMITMWPQENTKRPTAQEVLTQAQNSAFQLFYGKRTLNNPQNPRFMCAVPSSSELWILCDDIKGYFCNTMDYLYLNSQGTLEIYITS